MLCTGLAEVAANPGVPSVALGGLELVCLTDGRPFHQVPVALRAPSGRLITQNPSWFEATATGLRGYFMPDDDEASIYVYDITP